MVLYCSERCRALDASTPPSPTSPLSSSLTSSSSSSFSLLLTSPSTSAKTASSLLSEYESFIGRPLLSRRKPPSAPLLCSIPIPLPIPPVQHNGKPDMDPTEWKPDGSSAPTSTSVVCRSDAFAYLSQFHKSVDGFAEMSRSSSMGKNRKKKEEEEEEEEEGVCGVGSESSSGLDSDSEEDGGRGGGGKVVVAGIRVSKGVVEREGGDGGEEGKEKEKEKEREREVEFEKRSVVGKEGKGMVVRGEKVGSLGRLLAGKA